MASVAMDSQINYEEMLCIDGTGWNINLFENLNNIELYLCKSCGNVCRDASELGCDHDDELIDIYCNKCLDTIIKSKNNTCPIDNHSDPSVQSNRSMRKQIIKLQVHCPNADDLPNDIDDNMIYDTLDEKEGGNIKRNNKGTTKCKWKGTLNDLIKVHIKQCKFHDTDKIKIKSLTKQLLSIQNLYNQQNENIQVLQNNDNKNQNDINELNAKIFEQNKKMQNLEEESKQNVESLQNENNNNKNDIIELKQQMLAFGTTINDQSKLIKSLNAKIIEQNKKIQNLEQIIAKNEETKQNEESDQNEIIKAYRGIFINNNVSKGFTINNTLQITANTNSSKAAKLDNPLPVNTNLNDIYYWKVKMTGNDMEYYNYMIGVVSDKCTNFETDSAGGLVDCYGITPFSNYVCIGKNTAEGDTKYVDAVKSGDVVKVQYNCKLSQLSFSRLNSQSDNKQLYVINLPTQGVKYWFPAVAMYHTNATCVVS